MTAQLIVRRVRDAARQDELFPVWRYHPFFTDSTAPVMDADLTHRHHAVIETVFADLIDGPLAQMPSGRFGANSASVLCAAIAHNLRRAAGVLADQHLGRARGATLRRRIINIPARFTRLRRRPVLHPPAHWPWAQAWRPVMTRHHHFTLDRLNTAKRPLRPEVTVERPSRPAATRHPKASGPRT